MAAASFTRNANTLYITGGTDATTVLTAANTNVTRIIACTDGSSGDITLSDVTTTSVKLKIHLETHQVIDLNLYDTPIAFPNGIIAQLENANLTLTLILQSGGG